MKLKTLLSRSLLVAVGLLAGTSAWAQETTVTATLDHTAGAQWGSNTGASTVDAEKEHYNNDADNSWAGCAYAKFSFSIPEGNSITKATLTYTVNQGGKSTYASTIYYMAKDFDLDWSSFAGQTGTDLRNTANRVSQAVGTSDKYAKGDHTATLDVTNAVKAIYAAEQSYILFQWTGNAGGADLYGKGSSTNAPTLTITTTSATVYNITFKEQSGVAAKITVNDIDVTDGTTLGNGTYTFTATATHYDDYTGTFTVADADQEVSFAMTKKASVQSFTQKYLCNGEALDTKTIDVTDLYVGETYTLGSQKYWANGGDLYALKASTTRQTLTLAATNEIESEYEVSAKGNYYFYEFDGGYTTRADNESNGSAQTASATVTVPEDGVYIVTANCYGSAANRTASVTVGETTLVEATTIRIYAPGENLVSEAVSLKKDDVITVTTSDSKSGIDYVILQKLPTTVTINATSGLSSYSNASAVTVPDGVSIYVANAKPETGATTIELTKVTDTQVIPAGQGVLLYKAGGGAVTLTYGGTYTGTSYANNVLTGTGSGTKTVGDDETIYALVAGEQAIAKVAANVEIGSNKAYLPLDAALAKLNIVFDGTVTGIGSVQTTSDTNATNSANAIYNLSGQRVNSSYKGVVVKGGKKYINK